MENFVKAASETVAPFIQHFVVAAWGLLGVIALWWAWHMVKLARVSNLSQPEHKENELDASHLQRWQIWKQYATEELQVEINHLMAGISQCTKLGFLGTALGFTATLGAIEGQFAQKVTALSLPGLKEAFITTIVGLIAQWVGETFIMKKNYRLRKEILGRSYKKEMTFSDVAVNIYTASEKAAEGMSQMQPMLVTLGNVLLSLQDQIQALTDNVSGYTRQGVNQLANSLRQQIFEIARSLPAEIAPQLAGLAQSLRAIGESHDGVKLIAQLSKVSEALDRMNELQQESLTATQNGNEALQHMLFALHCPRTSYLTPVQPQQGGDTHEK